MGLLKGNNCSAQTRLRRVFMFLVIFRSSLVSGQVPGEFQYGQPSFLGVENVQPDSLLAITANISEVNITCLGDFHDSLQGDSMLHTLMLSSSGSPNVSGRCLYKSPVQLIGHCVFIQHSFGTMFQVQLTSPVDNAGELGVLQGLAFIVASDNSTQGEGGGYLGWLNSTTNGEVSPGPNFAVEIDLIQDVQFHDPPYAHIGVDINSLMSVNTNRIDVTSFNVPFLDNNAVNKDVFTVWIYYDVLGRNLYVSIGNINKKPTLPTMSIDIDLTETLSQAAFVGFTGSISNVSSSSSMGYQILFWTFSPWGEAPDFERNDDGTLMDPVVEERKRLREQRKSATLRTLRIAAPSIVAFLILMYIIRILYKRNSRLTALAALAKKYDIDESMLDRGPQKFKYTALYTATKGFSSDQLLGTGGFGSVYMGKLPTALKGDDKPTEIAVKRISDTSDQGASEFLAEVKIIGQAQHRNLVRLLGWCHDKGELLLVYDYMPNGSVDQHLYKTTPGEPVLTWSRRLKIVSGVATALAFLHDEWEQRVIHRDVKCSNIMLDHNFNGRLGDFGLARSSEHDRELLCTAVAGTRGYLAPELGITFRPTEKTDVYSFGAVVLEVGTGKKPILSREAKESLKEIFLVDWVWNLYRDDVLLDAADSTLHNAYDPREMIMFLKIGLLCCHPNPDERPTMRDVISIWKGSSPFPPLQRSRPVPVFPLYPDILALDGNSDNTTVTDTRGQADESGTEILVLDGDGLTGLTIPSEDEADSSPSEKTEGGNVGSANPTLRRRPHTTTSLPF